MRSVISRLIFSKQSIPRLKTMAASGNGRYMTTDSTKVDEPLKVDKTSKVEEAETVDVPPPPTQKLLVLGGSGFVGSHVCREALDRGLTVASLSRSGRSSVRDSWANHVTWHQGNLLLPDTLKEALSGATAVISCVGGLASNSHMYKINGTANINAIRAAAEQGVKRFVYISATDFGVANYLLQGYYAGKRAAETELLTKFPYSGVILRPGLKSAYAINKLRKSGYSKRKFYNEAVELYKEINTLMANGDKSLLRKAVTEKMYSALKNEIKQRESVWSKVYWEMIMPIVKMRTLRARLIGVDRNDLNKVFIQLTLEFLTKQKFEAYDSNGDVVAGDKSKEVLVHDIWVFEKSLFHPGAYWRLCGRISTKSS